VAYPENGEPARARERRDRLQQALFRFR